MCTKDKNLPERTFLSIFDYYHRHKLHNLYQEPESYKEDKSIFTEYRVEK